MGNKKSWRDYINSGDNSEDNKKTGSWRDYIGDNSTGSGSSSGGWRDYTSYDIAATVGSNITNRVNTWLKNHNTYISNYQNRYSGRKYNYEDSYVSDSGSWLDTVNKQKSNFDAEADSILSYMDQYKDYLDADWMKSVRETLTGARDTQGQIIAGATKDNEWWNSFGSEEMVSKYGSAEDAYKANQRYDGYSKKYTGKTSDELSKLIGDLDDGEEKEWLNSYASSVAYDEKGKADLNSLAKEIEDLSNLRDEAYLVGYWYNDYILGLTKNDGYYDPADDERKLGIYNRFMEEYGGDFKKLDSDIKKKEAYLKSATDIQSLNALSAVSGNADFLDKSKYVSNVEYGLFGKPEFTDDTYAYINNPTVEDKRALGAGQTTARALIESDHSTYSWDTPTRNRDSSYEKDALDYIDPEEVKIYNYLYATEGSEKAREYLDLLVSTFQERKNVETVKNASKFANEHPVLSPVLSSVLSVGTSLGSGFEHIENVLDYAGDKIMGKDAKLGTNEAALMTNAIRSTVSDKVDWEIGNWDAFDFLYNTTMSGVDSLASTAFGGAGGVVLGLSAAAQGTNDALNRGMSDGQAFWNGLFSGVFEGLFESLSIGNFNKLKETALNVGLKNINKTVIKTITKNLGKSMLVNASEEMLTELANITYDTLVNGEFSNYTLEELFEKGQWKNALNQVIESGASGALMGMGMSALGSSIGHAKGVKSANDYAVKNYGGKTDDLIQEGLESDVKSDSYKLATKYKAKTGSGKTLTGQQIRNLLAANQEQITPKDLKKIQKAAEARLTELGQTEDVEKLAELATKYVTGQKMSKDEMAFLANNKNGNRVAQEALPDNVLSGDYTSGWAEGIGTKQVNALAYNIKNIVAEMAKMNNPATYKSLEDRVSEDDKLNVSESGAATISKTNEAIDLSKPEIVDFVRDKETGAVTDMILNVDGKQVKASEIDFADADQSYLFSAVKKIENITPGDATAFVRGYKSDSGQTVGEYLNGIDEAYTYGYHNYSEADMGAGLFTPKLSSEQAKGAYLLGQTTRNKSDTNKSEAIKRMRTAVEAEAEKAAAEGKVASKAKGLTITYNEGGGKIKSFDKSGIVPTEKQGAGVEVAKILHKLGLGTNFEFFASKESDTLTVKDKKTGEVKKARVFINDAGAEEIAPAGVYRKSDGTIRIDLNAYNGRELTLNALAHELTHFIQQWSDTKYKVLVDFLMKTYEKTDMTMHQRVLAEQARLKDIRGEDVSYNEAYDEVVAKAMMKMFDDGKLVERLTELKAQDKDLAHKLWERFKEILAEFLGFYNSNDRLYKDSDDLVGMKDAFEQLQNMFAEALVEASENFQTSLIAKEAGLDIMPVEDGVQYSYSSLAEAAGFVAVENGDGTRSFTREGKKVSKVTVEDIDNSPIGAFINFSLEMGDISKADADRQKQMFADICTMASKTNDFAMTMQFVGSAVFTGMKANADKQYGTTYDFPSICTKTQAVIDAMSAKMVSLGRGLNTKEIVQLYDDVFASGNPVPCPECYVFSRWIGIGGLLDNIKKYQDYYGNMNVKDVAAAYLEMKEKVSKFAEEQGISFGKAKGSLTSKLTKEFNKLTEKIEKAQNQGEKVKASDKQRLAELEPMMNTVKSMTWLENVYFADSSLKKVNPNFRVPDSVLFDLNNGEAFATQYKEAWAFRTTQGAGYGKAITPYAEARLGEGVLVTNNTTNTIKGRAQGTLDNYFLQQMGKLDKKSRDALKRARLKQKIQAFIGGQGFQSTSDARYENASDYLLAALEMQAMRGMVQVYTKVDGAVPAFSAWGFSINQSLMPLNGGLDADGNVKDTAVGGMKPSVAFENRNKHESAGTITIGVNDNHIRAMFKQWVRDFIIPYHASGGKADTIAEFRRIQEGKDAKGEAVRSTDYSRTQSDKVLSDEVLRWQGKTDAQIQRIHEIRNARIAILTGGNPNMTVVRSNRFLSALYDKLNGGEWDGVKLAKSKVESQIFPNEFWDQTVTYEESGKITKDYLEYCEDLGFLHRFSGMIPSNGKLVPANGYDQNGNRVQLTDLAYQYDENGNKTDKVEDFFWKVLTDRRMYDNNGNYLAQKIVTLNDTTTDTVTGFAKNNQGREYDKAKAEALTKKILDNSSSGRENNLTNKQGRGEANDNRGVRKGTEEPASLGRTDGRANPGNAGVAQTIQEWGNQTSTVQRVVKKAVKTHINQSENADAIYRLLCAYVGKSDNEMTPNFYSKAVEILTEKLYSDSMTMDLDLFKGKWHIIGESIDNLYHEIRDTADNPDSAIIEITSDEYQQLVNHFGTTENYNVAGYLLKNGLMLDFSGKHWGDTSSKFRQVDHRDVGDAWETKAPNDIDDMVRMIANGNIRLMPESGGINLAVMPNKSQLMVLRDYIDHFRGEVIVDVDRVGDDTIHSFSYNKGTSSSRVIADIKAYFESGKIPEPQSDIGKFLFSSQETDADNAPTFYSQMGKVVEGMKQEKFGASSVISMLRGRGVKAEEIRWSGIQAFLDGKKSVTKQELLDFINSSMLQIEEERREKSNAHYEFVREWQRLVEYMDEEEILDGLNYVDTSMQPHLEDLVDAGDLEQEEADYLMELAHKAVNSKELPTKWDDYKLYGGDNYRELVFKMPGSDYSNNAMQAHWGNDAQGVLAHARIQDFDVNGKKMLFIEEIQSDWHNEGHKKGYVDNDIKKKLDPLESAKFSVARERVDMYRDLLNDLTEFYRQYGLDTPDVAAEKHLDLSLSNDYQSVVILASNRTYGFPEDLQVRLDRYFELEKEENDLDRQTRKAKMGVPDAPFRDNYHEYVLKRLLRMAAEEGYDSIGWTTAEIQSKRWSEDYAEGYRIEYDQDIPKFLKKYGKQWGAEVGKTPLPGLNPKETYYDVNREETFDSFAVWQDTVRKTIDEQGGDQRNVLFGMDGSDWIAYDKRTGVEYDRAIVNKASDEVWSMDITPAMKKSALKEGQAMYSSQETDADYMDALDKGDIVTAQKLVDQVANKAGYTVKAYHGTGEDFNIFSDEKIGGRNVWGKGFYFGESKGIANDYATWRESKGGKYRIVSASLKMENPYINRKSSLGTAEEILDKWFPDMWKDSRDLGIGYIGGKLRSSPLDLLQYIAEHNKIEVRDVLKAYGYDSIKDGGELVVFSPTQIKSNEPVVWDDNGKVIPLSKRFDNTNPDIRYSTQETDNISNRDLLANAFEWVVQNSEEYKLIQEYKGHIKILNEYEEKLSELNAEIRKLTFGTEGERDSKKLKELQTKAKEVAKNINRHDMKLLSLEASEPLRKVIEQERKKEAQKTKDHVKELLKNKKTRAEQTEIRHKIRKAVRDLDKLLNRGNKKTNVKEDMKGVVSKALELADYIFTDHISNDELIRRGITVRMTHREAALVKETEDILSQLYDNADNLTDEEFTKLDAKRKSNLEKLRDLLKAQRNESLNTPVYNLFNDLVTEYASLKNSSQESVKAAYNEELENSLRAFISDDDRVKILKNMRVADMTTEELNWLYRAYTMVLTNVRNANKFHVNGMNATIEQVVGQIAGDFSSRKIPDKKLAIAVQKLVNKLGWDYEKLYYALDRIGSEAFTKLIMNIANSENTVMQDVIEAAAFRDKMVKSYGFNNWDVNKEIDREFLDNTGKKFKLTLGQLMSLYAYSRREGAWDHIEYGGFVFGEAALTNPRPADSYKLSKEQCEAITNTLTKEQKGYVEDMQKFLSETMGAKGNEVSMLLYGIKMFGEKNYFPIHIAGQFKVQAQESQAKAAAGFSSMSNAGFTHAQNPNAKAPFVLEGFNEIWADHVNEMSRYHGTVPALEDLRRVMNRSTYSDAVSESQSIKQLMENSYGKEAVQYFDNLYREANSGAIQDKLEKPSKKLLSLQRKISVAYKMSVWIQQPTSIIRAYAMIDRKYFGFNGVGTITSGVAKAVSSKWNPAYANAYNEMLKYAPGVTMAKEIGGFDTHTGTSIRSYLLDTNKNLKQKWKTGTAMEKGKAVLDLVDDNAIANLPNVADKIAWIEIWNACKRETVAKHKDLATNSEEFMKIVGERFTEVIRATQVYDSMFSKSPMLKSKNLAVQYLVSFMNEPNTVANMAEKAMRDIIKGNKEDVLNGLKTAHVVIHSIIFTNVLKSIIHAMQDDDEEETYIEKYIEAVVGNVMTDFIPLSYIPYGRDVLSLMQGYDVERPDMAIISDIIDAYRKKVNLDNADVENMTEKQLIELDKKQTEANWKLVESITAFLGNPLKNVRKDVMGVYNTIRIASKNAGMTTAQSVLDKVIESIPFMSTPSKQDKLYDAIISGDKAYIGRLKSTYKTDDAYNSAVRKALRENDSRIHDAAQARYDGNTEEYKRIFREIQKEGKFTFDDIMSAINSEENAIKNKLEPDKATSEYSASDYVEALAMGYTSNADAMREDIIATKVANGKTQAEAEKEFISNVVTGIRDAYASGLLDDAGAEKMLMEYADKDEEEAAAKVSYWAFCEEHQEYKNDLSESNVNDYKEFAEPAEIPLDVFVQYINGTKGLVTRKDEWGDVEETKREQVLEVIDSLPLTWEQKDALYLAAGYSESKIWDVPW